jgi:putative ABC transport system permease protein
MPLLKLSLRNSTRSPARSVMTVLAVAISLLAFVVLRAVSWGWTEQVKQTPQDRVLTRHRMGWGRSLPVNYVQDIGSLPGVKRVLGASWVGLTHPNDPRLRFDAIAEHVQPFVEMHDEVAAPGEQKQAFIADRTGAFASRALAEEFGWQVGDRLRFGGADGQGDIELTLSGIFDSRRHGWGGRAIYFHWEYFNERFSGAQRDRVNMIVAQIENPADGARIARAIDERFEASEDQTTSAEDRAVMAQLVARFGAILEALDLISVLILGVVLLIIGNTVAMGVRERVKEYATLRALGFQPRHIIGSVLGEAAAFGVLGALLCLLVSYPLVEGALARFLQEQASFPAVHVSAEIALAAIGLGALLSMLAALLPARGVRWWRACARRVEAAAGVKANDAAPPQIQRAQPLGAAAHDAGDQRRHRAGGLRAGRVVDVGRRGAPDAAQLGPP